jgi:hypothetical protein
MSVSVLFDEASSSAIGVGSGEQQAVWGTEWLTYTPASGGQIFNVPVEGMTATGKVIALVSAIGAGDASNILLCAIVGTNVVALTFGATITDPASLVVNIIIQSYVEQG